MDIKDIITICKQRNELDFLFNITKHIAESDSIGEQYSYCSEYTKEMFNNAEKHIHNEELKKRGYIDEYCQYLQYGSIGIYELYLIQIGVITIQK